MKRLSILTFVIFFISCEKDDDKVAPEGFQFEATVINKGMDCGETFIISLKSIETNSNIEDGTYYADKLNSDFKVTGLKIYLNCREPNNKDEIYACTMMGPTYPHVTVIDCKKQ